MSTTVVWESAATPKVTLTLGDDGAYTAVLELDGLDPVRETTAEERTAGISSLDPPTVRARTVRALIEGAQRAVLAGAESTTGSTGGAAAIVLSSYRVALGVRMALRLLDEDLI